jgi:hypothetical protein
MTLSLRENQLVCDVGGGRTIVVDLSAALASWSQSGTLGPIPPLADESGCVRGHVFGREAEVQHGGDGPRLVSFQGLWVVPAKPACAR